MYFQGLGEYLASELWKRKDAVFSSFLHSLTAKLLIANMADVVNEQVSPAQAAAARRREKILSNSSNRMNLVTGKSEVLEPAPGKKE